jgi:hypothetical protein
MGELIEDERSSPAEFLKGCFASLPSFLLVYREKVGLVVGKQTSWGKGVAEYYFEEVSFLIT